MFKARMFATSVLAVGLLQSTSAFSQENNDSSIGYNPPAEGGAGEIIVTAQRRNQSLVEVPVAITAVAAEQLEESQINRVADLPQLVTGLRMDSNGSYGQPSIRGVGNSIAGTGFSNNVAVYVDGFYQPSQNTTDSMFLNIDGIEVLKGPQGTLFGRNATGGAILINLRKPSFDTSMEGRLSYSRFDTKEAAVYATTGIGGTVALDGSFAIESSDGYVKNVVTGDNNAGSYENWSGRVSVLWKPSDNASLHLAYQHAKQDDARPYIFNVLADPVTGAPQSLGAVIPGGVAPTRRGEVAYDYPNKFLANVDSVFLTGKLDIGSAKLTSYTMYRDERNKNYFDQDGSSVELFNVLFGLQNKTFTQELNVSGRSGPVDWLVGAFYYDSKSHQGPFPFILGAALTGGAPLTSELYEAEQDTKAWAVFADATIQLADKWYVTLGGRYSREKATAWYNIDPVAQAALGIGLSVGAVPGRSPDFSKTWSDFTPRASIRYEIDPDSSVYLTYSEGFKSGQLTPNAFVTTALEPEKIKAVELGYRHVGPRIRFDTSAFYYDYSNLQLAFYVSGTGVYRNAATSKIYGAEAQISADIGEGFKANLGVAYTHSEYTDFLTAPRWLPTGMGTFAATTIDASGFQMQRAPEWTANLGLRYETEVMGGTLAVGGNYYLTSKFPFDTAEQFYESSYSILNLRMGWTAPNDLWEIAVFGTNVTDEKYRTQVLPGDFGIQQIYGKPASYGVSLSFKFD